MTEGIKDFIGKFEYMWLFDEMARAIEDISKENCNNDDLFNVISVTAKNGKVDINVNHDTNEPIFYHRHIAHSDIEDGLYETWLISIPQYNEITEELIGISYTWLLKSEY